MLLCSASTGFIVPVQSHPRGKSKNHAASTVTHPGCLGACYTGLGAQTLAPRKGFLTFFFEDFFETSTEKSVSLFNLRNLENVLQRNLRTGTARECIFGASGDTRFKNFHQTWWRKGGGGTPRCNWSFQKNSGHVTDPCAAPYDKGLIGFSCHLLPQRGPS